MKALFVLFISLSVWLLGITSATLAQDGPAVAEKAVPKRVFTDAEIAQRVKDLGSETFAVREAAMKELREAGRPAIGPLVEATKSGELEVTLRAVRILESILTTGSLDEFEAAEAALEELKREGGKSAGPRAEAVLASVSEIREKRAIAAITRLNGSVKPDPSPFGFAGGGPQGEDLITTVVLKKNWQGGEEGLKHLENLRFLRTVYVVEGVFPPEAIARLENKMPHLNVMLRGSGQLGVGGAAAEGGCAIGMIQKDSAADKAGLMEGDLIVAFNGKRGKKDGESLDFDRLVELLKEHDAGEKVPLLIRRNGREQIVHVVLDDWK